MAGICPPPARAADPAGFPVSAVSNPRDDQGRALSILRKNGYRLKSNPDKLATRLALDELIRLRDFGSVGDVLAHIRDTRIFPLLDDLVFRLDQGKLDIDEGDEAAVNREAREQTFYSSLFELPYVEVKAYAEFFADHTPFATKHGVKGDEFDTVLVVLDDDGANWNIYSFSKFLGGEDLGKNPKRWSRSRNVFYVCCSRAKINLAVIDLTARSAAKDERARTYFGAENSHFLN